MTSSTIPAQQPVSSYASLPFVAPRHRPRKGQLPRNFWSVKASGDYEIDCETGEAYALLFLAAEAEANSGTMLEGVVSDMPRDADFTGLELGFITMIGFAAQAGAGRAREVSAYWARCEAERKAAAAKGRAK